MAEEECFNLRWSNYQRTVMDFFDSLLQTETLVDVTLASEGKWLRAHRLILSAYSDYFKELLTFQSEKHAILYLRDVPFSHLEYLIAFMYRGEVNISQAELPSFIKTSESLRIRGLSESYHRIQELATGAVDQPTESTARRVNVTSRISETASNRPNGSPIRSSSSSARRSKRLRSKSPNTKQQPIPIELNLEDNVALSDRSDSARNVLASTPQLTVPAVDSSDFKGFSPQSNSRVPMVAIRAPTWEGNSMLEDPLCTETSTEREAQEVDLGTLDLDNSAKGGEEDWSDVEGQEITQEEFGGLQKGDSKIAGASLGGDGSVRKTRLRNKGKLVKDHTSECKWTLIVTGLGEKRFQCIKCSKHYKHKRDARRHCNYECDSEPRYICPYCSCKSRRKYKLRSHILSQHNNHDVPLYLKTEVDSHGEIDPAAE